MNKPEYYAAMFSGGKDSTAMVLELIERGYPLDEVICCDTTMEFPAMYRHIEKVKKTIEDAGIKFTTLRADHNFEHYLAERHIENRKPTAKHFGVPGMGWPSFKSRWCTKYLKTELMRAHLKALHEKYTVLQYIGIAADEDHRLDRKHNQDPSHRHPLREWGWTEKDAIEYCRAKGYDWEGLYDIFHRVSCWCCPLQPYSELRKLRRYFPELWEELRRLDAKQWQTFAHDYRIPEIEKRFALEDALTEAGHSIKNRQFFTDLKRHLAGEASVEEILQERAEAQLSIFN